MKNISELAMELKVGQQEIIVFLMESSPSNFSSQRLGVNPYIGRVWGLKVRNHFYGKTNKPGTNNLHQEKQKQKGEKIMKISDLAKELLDR